MDANAEKFIHQFHNLPGNSIKDKHSSLFKLLRENCHLLSTAQLDLITSHLEPETHPETIFYADFLIYFKRYNELYLDFQRGHDITVSKVCKQDWFFQTAFKNLGASEFVNEILPTMSYSVRLKILKKLYLNVTQSDAIYDALVAKYGVFVSTVFLLKCSPPKIGQVLKKVCLKLTPRQLKQLYDKHPELIYLYLEEIKKIEGNVDFINSNPVLIYIAQKDPEMFANLVEKYSFTIQLGGRTTKRFIAKEKSAVLNKPFRYIDKLRKESLVRKLGSDFRQLFLKVFPEKGTASISNRVFKLLRYYPKSLRFQLFQTTYNQIYHHDLDIKDHQILTTNILELISDPEKREACAKIKHEQEDDNNNYFKYYKPETVLKIFQDKLNELNASEREEYVGIITGNCVFNRDLDVLLKLCVLVSSRLKNDQASLHSVFVNAITKQIIDDLSEMHWKYIVEILELCDNNFAYPLNYYLQIRYIYFLIKNNKPYEKAIQLFHNSLQQLWVPEHIQDIQIIKTVFVKTLETGLVPTKSSKKEEDTAYYDAILINNYLPYLKKSKFFKDINVYKYSRILNSVKYILENATPNQSIPFAYVNAIEFILCTKNPTEEIKQLQALYFEKYETFLTNKGLNWFLKEDPGTFKVYFENVEFKNYELHVQPRTYNYLRSLSLGKKIAEHFSNALEVENIENNDREAFAIVMPLSILLPPISYLELLKKSYLPTSDKVELTEPLVKRHYFLQSAFVKCLKYIKNPKLVIDTVLLFCRGDYLRFALKPLYSSIYNIPELDAKRYLDRLNQMEAGSVKKHATHLNLIISDTKTAINCLKQANFSIILPLIRYFIKNPSEELWEVIEIKLTQMDENSSGNAKTLITFVMPTMEYRVKYFELLWDVLENLKNNALKTKFVETVNVNIIKNLSFGFINTKILPDLSNIAEKNATFFGSLVVNRLQIDKFDFILNLLKRFKSSLCDDSDSQISRNNLKNVIKAVFNSYMELKPPNRDFLVKFTDIFVQVFDPSDCIEEFLMVSLLKLKGEPPESHCKDVMFLYKTMFNKYGNCMTYVFPNVINKYLSGFLKERRNIFKFCFDLLQLGETVDDSLLVIEFLPRRRPTDADNFRYYKDTLEVLKQVQSSAVTLRLNLYLSSQTT